MPREPVVLDTNVVLDCWLFQAPCAQSLRQAVDHQHLRWLVTAEMLGEFESVLGRPLPARWEPRRKHMLSACPQRQAVLVSAPPELAEGLRCTDGDDQKFLDLALRRRARWLVTRDRALLRLARRAGPLGLAILPPERWPGSPAA